MELNNSHKFEILRRLPDSRTELPVIISQLAKMVEQHNSPAEN
ncbi:hypothetical protein [Paenibacillus lentus]|nr:hypothetical protein [Paenibacillus lentus]